MHKVLIVDDESWVVESLKDLVDWERHGFEIVGQAYNGSDALASMKELEAGCRVYRYPDAGDERSRIDSTGRNLGLPILFVVVSGYAEFAYAQKAISYGAIAYCLKPFDEIELAGVLLKLDKMLPAAKPAPASSLLHFLEEPGEGSPPEAVGRAGPRGLRRLEPPHGIAARRRGRSGLDLHAKGPCVRLKTGASKSVYLLRASEAITLEEEWRTSDPAGPVRHRHRRRDQRSTRNPDRDRRRGRARASVLRYARLPRLRVPGFPA